MSSARKAAKTASRRASPVSAMTPSSSSSTESSITKTNQGGSKIATQFADQQCAICNLPFVSSVRCIKQVHRVHRSDSGASTNKSRADLHVTARIPRCYKDRFRRLDVLKFRAQHL